VGPTSSRGKISIPYSISALLSGTISYPVSYPVYANIGYDIGYDYVESDYLSCRSILSKTKFAMQTEAFRIANL
jgi:hypothetical protein